MSAMGRAIFSLLLGFVAVFGVAFWARTCLPTPTAAADWLHRKTAIIVQIEQVRLAPTASNVAQRIEVAYGDGTLISKDVTF